MKRLISIFALLFAFVSSSANALTFTDTFAPPSPLWSNSIGNWTGGGGQYFAQNPSNSPETYSGLPFDFTNSNFALTVTINNLRDEYVAVKSVEEQCPSDVTLIVPEGHYIEPDGPHENITFAIRELLFKNLQLPTRIACSIGTSAAFWEERAR